jgi:hypothetical protein
MSQNIKVQENIIHRKNWSSDGGVMVNTVTKTRVVTRKRTPESTSGEEFMKDIPKDGNGATDWKKILNS